MTSKAQRKKERRDRKKLEQRKRHEQLRARQESQRRADSTQGGNARHRQRLAQQVPQAWAGEIAEDVAVFDDAALSTLPPEVAGQVVAVRTALEDATESRRDDALDRVSAIPRGSSLSEWRLFVRGLVDWLADNPAAASEAWKRLDPGRRPGRIATAMMLARRPDLGTISSAPLGALPRPQDDATAAPPAAESPAAESPARESQAARSPAIESPAASPPASSSPDSAWGRFDAQQLYHARLLRRVRFDRAALRVAEAGLGVPDESKELLLGPKKMRWLRKFISEYAETEPDLTAALAEAALLRACEQRFADLFDEAVRSFPGPRHDRWNRLLTFFFYHDAEEGSLDERKSERSLQDYLSRDLPQNEALSAPLRGALLSQIHLNEAVARMRPPSEFRMIDVLLGRPSEDEKAVREHLQAAVKAAPANGPAYKAYVNWIESRLADERLKKPQEAKLENELANVMRGWSQGVPAAIEPRLWLVDHFLENEELEEARPHVEFLAASRHDNPRVRATPWKWQLLEAMRLCRRKAWLAEAPARLDEAERLWPAWLPKEWLPYLRAACTLRSGRTEAFEEQRRRICEEPGRRRDSLAEACMMLGAAQRMRASATELKPLRAALDQALKGINQAPLEDLLETGGFFWDLHRAQLVYPAYRMHAKTIGKELFARLESSRKLVLDGIDDERIHKAVLWGSEHRFWPNNYETKFPSFFSLPALQKHPVIAAATLNAFLKETYLWGVRKHRELGPLLRDAAGSRRDAYERHWFAELADRLDDALAKDSSRGRGFPFGNLFGGLDDDDDDDDDDLDDDDLRFDPDCNCPRCRAARKAAAARTATS